MFVFFGLVVCVEKTKKESLGPMISLILDGALTISQLARPKNKPRLRGSGWLCQHEQQFCLIISSLSKQSTGRLSFPQMRKAES